MKITNDTKPHISHYPGKRYKWACSSKLRYAVGRTKQEAYKAWKGKGK